jgi:acetyltransferase
MLSEIDSKKLLKAYGIASPKEGLARDERQAVALAKKIGFPVVAKLVSAKLAHKSDIGGVMLGLETAADVRAAYARLMGPVAKRARIEPDGVLIAAHVSDGLELVLGMNRDPEMGPVILFGAGGVELELDRDVALAPPPLDKQAAKALIVRTRVSRLVEGYRGKPALDEDALVKALLSLSQLAMDAGPRIASIDVNPLLLRRRGALALDALIVLSDLSPI